MLEKIDSGGLFISNLGWLVSRFHFSFDTYMDPNNIQFGDLRVLNDDIVQPQTGFGKHPHRDMEIVSYCVTGSLTHEDSMGNKETLTRGDVQYMTAGKGITHSEMNDSLDEPLRFLQIWILPDKKGREPQYGSMRFSEDKRHNKLLNIVSGNEKEDTILIFQDANIFVAELDNGNGISYHNALNRQAYLICIEGDLEIHNVKLKERDALKIVGDENLNFKTDSKAHFLLIDIAKAK